jgi:protein-L-isoaspartate(D-aspartate) O-methyltransferase
MANSTLVNYLMDKEVLQTPRIIDAFLTVDRAFFIPMKYLAEAYNDFPLPVGDGKTTIQPTTAAIMLELLQPEEGDKVLEIGAGSGWTTALLCRLVEDMGHVFSFEINRVVGESGKTNLSRFLISNYTYKIGDARKYWYDYAPYQRIVSTVCIPNMYEDLIDMLSPGGTMVIPTNDWDVRLIKKDDEGEVTEKIYSGFVYVPLQ